MKYIIDETKKGSILAYECLKLWFDPAREGSPYELGASPHKKNGQKKYQFFHKKLSIRI